MFKLALLLLALAAFITLSQAAPMLAERSPPSLNCAPSNLWSNGSLSLSGEFSSGGPGQLAIRTFTNKTTGKPERRLSKWVEGRADLTKLTNVNGQFCNSTTFNYTYQLPQMAFEKNNPLKIRTPQFGIPSGYGYNYTTCLGVGHSNWTPQDSHTGKLPTKGSFAVSVQECESTDFQQIAATQAQFFQRVYKYGFITTANGNVNGDENYSNPPQVWQLVIDDKSGDVIATSNDPDPGSGNHNALYITSKH